MFENLGFSEIALIAVVFLIFFGPKKIPELMNGIGRGVREFRKAMNEVQGELTNLTHDTPEAPTIKKPGPTASENHSSPTE